MYQRSLQLSLLIALLAVLLSFGGRGGESNVPENAQDREHGLRGWLKVAAQAKGDGQICTYHAPGRPEYVGCVYGGRVLGAVRGYNKDGQMAEIHHFERGKLLFSSYLTPAGKLAALNQHDRTGRVIAAMVSYGYGGGIMTTVSRDPRGVNVFREPHLTPDDAAEEQVAAHGQEPSEEFQFDPRTGLLTNYERITEGVVVYSAGFDAGRPIMEFHGTVAQGQGAADAGDGKAEQVDYYPGGGVMRICTWQGRNMTRQFWWSHTGEAVADCQYDEGKPWDGTLVDLDPDDMRKGFVRRVKAGVVGETLKPFTNGDPWPGPYYHRIGEDKDGQQDKGRKPPGGEGVPQGKNR